MSHSRNVMVKQESRVATFICFVCGSPSIDIYPLYSKAKENGPYFPFLELHQPPNGSVRPGPDGFFASCILCFSFLTQQWESHERNNLPHSKRLYWLKRNDNGPYAGMDAGLQSEYATSYMGFAPSSNSNQMSHHDKRDAISPADSISQSTLGSQYNKHDYPEPIDCSVEDQPQRMTQIQRMEEPETSASVLDLSVQTRPLLNPPSGSVSPPNSSIVACYACGEDAYRGSLINVYTKPISNCPYFPNLWNYPRPAKAKPIDAIGKVEVCELCHKYLIRQWDTYQRANVPNNERHYQLRGSYNHAARETNANNNNNHQFFCYTCGQEYPKSVRRELKTRPSTDGEPYFRFLETHNPAPGARPITHDGRAMVCTLCYKALFRQFRVYQIERTPEEHRTYKIPAEFLQESNVLRDRLLGQHSKNERPQAQASNNPSNCYLCDRASNSLKLVDTLPNQASKMYFPFIREMTKPAHCEAMDNLGRCLICLTCYLLLQTQWEAFQNGQVPVNQRHYSLNYSASQSRQPPVVNIDVRDASPPSNSSVTQEPKNHNSALHIQVTIPEDQSSSVVSHHEPLLTTVSTMSYTSVITTPSRHIPTHPPPMEPRHSSNNNNKTSKESAIDDNNLSDNQNNNPRIYNPLELPSTKQPLMVATTCFVCGECSAPGYTYPISVFPSRSGSNSEDYQTPFFPFLSKHVKPTAADVITEDGTILGCTFCFHSLMAQWLAYETSPHAEDANHWTRKYNCHHYVCYICGITTYRKRVRAITVRDFPFLVEHPRPPGALTTQNGESVVTCLTCFESLMSQWKDFERMKLPVEMRKYNWIPIPPPPDDINLIDPATRHQNLSRDSTPAPSGPSRTPPSHNSGQSSHQEGSSRHDNQSGLGHGVSKPAPSMLNMQQPHTTCNNAPKPVSVRSMATAVSPLYQVGPQPTHAPPSSHGGAPNHNLGVYGGSPAAAYNAARTSSFAAALRKLAKQAVDPATEKDLSPITPVSSPAYSQRSTTPKRSIPQGVYMNNVHPHSHQSRLSSPPPSSNSLLVNNHHEGQKQPLDLGSMSSRESNGNRLGDPLLKHDGKYDKRDDHYSIKDLSSSHLQSRSQRLEEHQPPIIPTTSSSSGRGFQPYRGLDDANRHSLGSHGPHPQGPSPHQHPTPPSHHLPSHYEHPPSGYPYTSAFLPAPPHLAHPAYRFEDPVFLNHYGSMLRSPSLMHPLSQAGLLPPPPVPQPSAAPSSVPFFPTSNPGAHYPRDLMISQAQSFVSPGSSSTNHDSRMKYDDRMNESDSYDRRDHPSSAINRRLSDPINEGNSEQRSSPIQPLHLSRHLESPDHRHGSITHGTPRDHHHPGLGPPPPSRSPESPNGGASTPLNLAIHHHPSGTSNQDLHRSRHHDVELWVARQASNAANNLSAQNHHLQERHERHERYSPSAPPSHPPPPLLSAQPPSQHQHQTAPLDQHQVPIRTEYHHPHPPNNYHGSSGGPTQEDINRQQFHLQQYHLQRQQQQQRKHSSSHSSYNLNNETLRTNNYDKGKSNKFNSSKVPENSHSMSGHSNHLNVPYNGAIPRLEDHNRPSGMIMDRENISDGSRSTEKAVTLDRWAYYRQESRLMELEKPTVESKEPPSVPSHHFSYTQHQSAEHARGFQAVPRTSHVESNCVEILVSKLDLEEARLKKARVDGTYVSDSESSDNEENAEGTVKARVKKDDRNKKEPWLDWGPRGLSRPFILSKGPPLKPECEPRKMEILKSVGLTTTKRRKELELEKFLRRQQQLKESVPLKVIKSEDQENQRPIPVSLLVSPLSFRPSSSSNSSTKKVNGENGKSKWQQKSFMEALELKVNSHDEIREEQDVIWKAILHDRSRRHRIPLPLMEIYETNGASNNNNHEPNKNDLGPRGTKRKISDTVYPNHNGLVCNKNPETFQPSGLSSNHRDNMETSLKDGETKSHHSPQHRVLDYNSKKFLNPRHNIPSQLNSESDSGLPSVPPPLIPSSRSLKPMTGASDSDKRVAFLTTTPISKGTVTPSSNLVPPPPSKDKPSNTGLKPPPLSTSTQRQMPREFVQEFHQLVLQTTKQQMESTISREPSSLPIPPLFHNPSSSSNSTKNHQSLGASYSGMPKLANSSLLPPQISSIPSVSSLSDSNRNNSVVKMESSVHESFSDRDSDGCLKWPGIEAIMESYEKHRREQNLERDFLTERCDVNQSRSRELDRAAEIYSHRMNELYQLKRHLDEERQRHQSAIDNLKKSLRQIR